MDQFYVEIMRKIEIMGENKRVYITFELDERGFFFAKILKFQISNLKCNSRMRNKKKVQKTFDHSL